MYVPIYIQVTDTTICCVLQKNIIENKEKIILIKFKVLIIILSAPSSKLSGSHTDSMQFFIRDS